MISNIFSPGLRNNKWYLVVLWWELARIPFNLIIIFAGLLSFYIAYVTIPIVYEVIGFLLNCFFTLGWIIELAARKRRSKPEVRKFRIYFFFGYLLLCLLLVLSFSLLFKLL